MENILKEMIGKSGLEFLNNYGFEEKTPGRFFQIKKIDLCHGVKQFYVVLGPKVESPEHNHKGENMTETHLLVYGSGRFILRDRDNVVKELVLEQGRFHPIFSTCNYSPTHKYVAGPDGSILLALEMQGL